MYKQIPPKILWFSNAAHVGTGYGVQTALFTPRIQAAGHPLTVFAFYGREGAPAINADGLMELPRLGHAYGLDVLPAHAQYAGAEVVFSLIDPFALDPAVMGQLAWAAWVPVDSVPVKWGNVQALQAARWVIAMSQFGRIQLEAAGFADVLYCPHGIDLNVYRPSDRRAARAAVEKMTGADLTDKFLVIDVAANKGRPARKNFHGLMLAFREFAQAHPSALLYIHADAPGLYGEDLHLMAQAFGLGEKVLFPDPYLYNAGFIPASYLNHLYNAADVMCHPAYGEGFGLPVVEAQAAGCPVIVTDATAMTELCFGGYRVPAIPINAGAEGSSQFLPLHPELLKGLEWAYARRGDDGPRQQAQEGALWYDVERVFERFMTPVLGRITADLAADKRSLAEKRERRQARRSERRALREELG